MFENQDIMIQGISIENFRGFHKTTVKGFERINLFGGKNNVGKTSFLEAIYVGLKENIFSITQSRKNQVDISGDDEYVFYNQNKNIPAKLVIYENESNGHIISINGDFLITNSKFDTSKNGIYEENYVPFNSDYGKTNKVSLILDKKIQYPIQYNLSAEFDKADKKGESDEILKAIQVIEPNIMEIKTYSDHPGMIYLRKEGEKQRIPLIYYGDAIQKVMRYIITIAAFQNENGSNTEGGKYLLIDEIENGLHYTVQEEFWKMLFKLAITYDIQIFAATHSREMITAFDKRL